MPTERSSKLDRLTADERGELIARLHAAQNQVCYVCHEVINPQVHEIDIDHIIALARRGPDEESNWGLTHANCNRSKGTRDLQLQRLLHEFRTHVLKYTAGNAHGRDRNFTLNEALDELQPNRQEVGVVIRDNQVELSWTEDGEPDSQCYRLLLESASLSGKSFVGMIPFVC